MKRIVYEPDLIAFLYMNLLVIDGGGCKIYYSNHLLYRYEQEYKTRIHKYYDAFAGVSIGSFMSAFFAFHDQLE